MKKIKDNVINILNWLKDKKNLALILFAVLTLSVFKIAFFGINTNSYLNNEYIDINGRIDFEENALLNISNKYDVQLGTEPMVIHIETPAEQYERYKTFDYIYKKQHPKQKPVKWEDLQPDSEPERETP